MLNETLTIGCISWQFREYLFGLKSWQLDPQRQSCRYDNVPKHKQASVIHTHTKKQKQKQNKQVSRFLLEFYVSRLFACIPILTLILHVILRAGEYNVLTVT